MNTETRLTRLENLVNALIKRSDLNKFYQNADIAGANQGVLDNTNINERQDADIDFIAMEMEVDL